MREIKFRAWVLQDEVDGEYIAAEYMEDNVEAFHDPLYEHKQGNIVLMQYTGLKDKNGKEIYEGDIVKAWSTGSCGTFEVRWRQGGAPCFMLYPAFQNGERWRLHGTQDKHGNYYDDVEVIGNIHENPELIKN